MPRTEVPMTTGDTLGISKPEFSYSKITDPVLRASIKTGELIINAAISQGIDLKVDALEKGDWFGLRANVVMNSLIEHGDQTARNVLKRARGIVKRSNLNGDAQQVRKTFSDLMKMIGRPKILELPPIPTLKVAKTRIKQ